MGRIEPTTEFVHPWVAAALSFDTWRTPTREQQLTDDQALELMIRLPCDCPGSGRADEQRRAPRALSRV
jgi:hypothetical protein